MRFPLDGSVKTEIQNTNAEEIRFNESFSGLVYPASGKQIAIGERIRSKMSNANQEIEPTRYIIKVKNHLDSNWERWFEGMTITHIDDGVTMLSGDVVDQSALYGLLQKLHNLNLSLILVQKVNLE